MVKIPTRKHFRHYIEEPARFNHVVNGVPLWRARLRAAQNLWKQRSRGLPKEIAPETAAYCFLGCKYCWLGKVGVYHHRDKKFMDFETFKTLMDQVEGWGPRITLAGTGEPLMNTSVYNMITYASAKGLLVTLFTNAVLLNEKNRKVLLHSGLYKVCFALEALDAATFDGIRSGEKFGVVEENIRDFIRFKKRLGIEYPKVQLSMVLTKKNQHQADAFMEYARAIGADSAKLKVLGIYPCASEEFNRYVVDELWIPEPSRFNIVDGKPDFTRIGPCPCKKGPGVVTVDGDVLLCQYDFYAEHKRGNIHEFGFTEIWDTFRGERSRLDERRFSICDMCGDTTRRDTHREYEVA